MRQYIKYLCLVVLLPVAVIVPGVLLVWHIYVENVNLKVEEGRHLVVFGNSMSETCINDTLLCDITNCSYSGLNHVMGKNFYISFLEQNRQVDTVLIALGEFTFSNNTDKNIDSKYLYLPYFREFASYIAYMGSDVFSNYNPDNMICCLMSVKNMTEEPPYRYYYLDRNNLLRDEADWGIGWYDRVFPVNKDSLSYEESLQERSMLVSAVRDIIEYCHKTGRMPVIFNPPSYHITDWIDDTNYNLYLLSLEGVLIADYTDFELPDDNAYRGDVHHLNHLGAEYFSTYIKRNGWHFETPQQYHNRRTGGKAHDSTDRRR